MEQVDDGSRDVLPAPPPGTVRDASGNVRIKDIKDSTIIRDSTSGRRGNWLQTALSTVSLGGLGAYLDKINGLDWKVVGILAGVGVVILGAGMFTDWKFGGIFQARKQMHDKGIV